MTAPTTPRPGPSVRSYRTGLFILGSDSKALFRPRVNNASLRKPLRRKAIHARPVEAAALASSAKRLEPAMRNLGPELIERLDVGWHAVIRVMNTEHGTQPFTLRSDRFVPATVKLVSYLMNFGCQTATHRTTQ